MAFRGRIVLGIALVLTMIAPVGAGNNPDTTFTYQGRLRSGGLPANGTYNVSFSLWTASSGGTQVGPTINRPNLPVTNGVFSQQLDFGNPIITTGRLYLEIVVDAQTLSPRQELTNAFGSIHTRGVHVSAAGDVGIGTDAPMELLDVSGNALMRGDLDLDGSLKLNHGIGETEIRPIGNDAWLVNFATGKLILATTTNTAIASSRITVTNDGLVGIGNSVPSTKLHVLGGTDVTASGGGFLQMGPSNGLNVGLDDNEIAAHDNGVPARLSLQAPGGDLSLCNGGGSVGVRISTPAFALHVNGTAGKPGGGSWSVASDRRLKANIAPLEGALDQLLALEGVTFEYIDPDAIGELSGPRIGMIAQDVETVFPDWVDVRADGYKMLTYRGFEALTVEALRELQAQNTELREANASLQERLDRLERLVEDR